MVVVTFSSRSPEPLTFSLAFIAHEKALIFPLSLICASIEEAYPRYAISPEPLTSVYYITFTI